MFLRAGALSLALLLASRVLGVLRESAVAAAFGRSASADLAVLMLALPDWLASVTAAGALSYVLLPAWAAASPAQVAVLQRRVGRLLLAGSTALAIGIALLHQPLLRWLVAGLPQQLEGTGRDALFWSAAALPAAFLAALWATRLQHERDFAGLYAGHLLVNAILVAALVFLAGQAHAIAWLGGAFALAMAGRLLWYAGRMPRAQAAPQPGPAALPPAGTWAVAVLAAGLPLALPFAARSAASPAGEGALATFNYAWKLVELPQILAIQLVASLALPAVARALAAREPDDAPVRQAFVLAWTLGCACLAGLQAGGHALAELLFGWGRMTPDALELVSRWATAGSWSLLPQALGAVALTVLAAERRMAAAAWAYGAALLALLALAAAGVSSGEWLMYALAAGWLLVAAACLAALRRRLARWLPWQGLAVPLVVAALAGPGLRTIASPTSMVAGLLFAALAGILVLAAGLWRSPELRHSLRR